MPEFFVNKSKRGRKAGKDSAIDYGNAIDKPEVVASIPIVSLVTKSEKLEKATFASPTKRQ